MAKSFLRKMAETGYKYATMLNTGEVAFTKVDPTIKKDNSIAKFRSNSKWDIYELDSNDKYPGNIKPGTIIDITKWPEMTTILRMRSDDTCSICDKLPKESGVYNV